MLGEAKRICDTLVSCVIWGKCPSRTYSIKLVSPSRLTTHPPPPPYFVSGYPTPMPPQPPQTGLSASVTNGKTPTTAAPVISDPQSFVVPMGQQQAYPYGAPAYPTAPYYAYGYGGYYPPVAPSGPSTATVAGSSSGSTGGAAGSGGNQGAWSEEETKRLKNLAEEHRNGNGEIIWDTLCEKWGNSRTR